ncbi:HTH domain-containing protein [Leptospira weilii]|uniref:HTH domain-containing protein n=1 Tax=Leptospira weilii TaxID=28184 RepID=UPI00256F2D5F|nr:HTH domain-containing protein [Leptospira weilii]MDL5245015.1 HTH domain-containing protein [Leptospira weilii]
MNFLEFSIKVLKESNRPLTHIEIWEIGKEKGYDTRVSSKGKTPWQTIAARIYVDIRDNTNSPFIKLKLRPTKFFLKELMSKELEKLIQFDEDNSASIKKKELKFAERDLHKYLSYYLYNYHFIYSKTIFHENSNKKIFAQWAHPDVVGVHFTITDWENEVIDIARDVGSLGIKLFSYEIKIELNFGNLRESFFQAVSNSSWAHEGYLVVTNYDQDDEFYEEYKRLSNSFGIGLIFLDVDDPDSSRIIFQAKTKDFIDIDTMNKIATINPDFKEFLKRIRTDLTSREIRKEKYDKVEMVENLENKKGFRKVNEV